MLYPNQNNQQKDAHASTRGAQFFNVNGFEPSTMILGMWNQLVTLRIHPAKEKSQQTKTSVYDYDKSVSIVLDNKSTETLADIVNNEIIPALENGVECTKAVVIGTNSAVIVSTGVKKTSGKPIPYLAIARNIKPGVLIPEDMLSYTFNTSMILNNYDGNSGNSDFDIKTCQIPYQAEIKLFGHMLNHLAVALVGGEYHASRNLNKKYDDSVFAFYKQLANKNGIEFYNSNNGYNRGPSVFGGGGGPAYQASGSSNFTSTMDTKPEEVGSLDELNLDEFA